MIARLTQVGPRPARPRLLSERGCRPGPEAHRLSGLSRPAADPGRRARTAPRAPPPSSPSSAASPRRTGPASRIATTSATYNRWAIADFAAQRAGLRLGRAISRETGACRPAQHPGLASRAPSPAPRGIVAETPLDGAQGLSAAAARRQCRALSCRSPSSTPISPSAAPSSTARRRTRTAGSAASTLVTGSIPDDVSRVYVERHFPPEAKARGRRAGAQRHRRDGPPPRQA